MDFAEHAGRNSAHRGVPTGWLGVVGLVAVSVMALLAMPTLALADVEPNNGITQAEGPLAGGVTYNGTVANENDLDTYFFYVAGQQQIAIDITNTGEHCENASLGDSNNRKLDGTKSLEPGQSTKFTYSTPPGTSRYYIELESECSGEGKYSFVITPAAAVATGPSTLPPTPTGEPNESAEQASGPLLGNVAYTGELQTINDQDWFKFYTAPGTHQFDVAYTEIDSSCEAQVTLTPPGEDESPEYSYAYRDEWRHFTLTSPTAGVYYLSFEGGCVGARYEFVIEPPSALTTEPPAPSAPVPPAPPVSAPAKPRRGYAIARRIAKVRHGQALVELSCAGAGDCEGTVDLVARLRRRRARRKLLVGHEGFALSRGESAVLAVGLSRRGIGLLHLSRKGRLRVHLAGHDVKSGLLLLTARHPGRRHRHRGHRRMRG